MIKLYGGDLSAPANKVRFVLNYLDMPFEYHPVKIREGENRTPDFLKLHPAGKIPVLLDGDFVLFESNAICRYLCDKKNSALYPRDLKKRAVIDQWLDFGTIHVGAAVGRVLFNRVFAPIAKVDVDERSLSDGLMFLDRFLPVIEKQLAPNLCGQELTLADLNLLANLDPCPVAGIDLSGYPALSRWLEQLKKKKFYQDCYAEYGEPLKGLLKQG